MRLTILQELFAGFLRARHMTRHFRRRFLPDAGALNQITHEIPPSLAQALRAVALAPSASVLDQLGSQAAGLNEDGLRVVAVASRAVPATRRAYGVVDEKTLVLAGTVAFLDPPKESTREALTALAAHGVAVKVLTGDNERITAKVCREVGLAPHLRQHAQIHQDDGQL